MGMMSVCLGGATRTGVPEARLLTCFITSFTLVFISSTTRFTPKAPGFSCSKICLYTSLGGGGGRLPGPSSFQKCAGGLLSDREAPETGSWVITVQSVSNQKDRLSPGRGPAGFHPLLRFALQKGRAGVIYCTAYTPKSTLLFRAGGSWSGPVTLLGSLDACVALPEFKVARSSF